MKAQQSKLLVQNGVKRIMCVHTCWSQSSSIWVFAFLSGMNALDVKFVKAHWHACSKRSTQTASIVKRSLQSPVLRVALAAEHCFLTHFLRHQNWRLGVKGEMPICHNIRVIPKNNSPHNFYNHIQSHNDKHSAADSPSGSCLICLCSCPCFARHMEGLCCCCLQLQRSMQGWWGKRQNGFAPWTCRHP